MDNSVWLVYPVMNDQPATTEASAFRFLDDAVASVKMSYAKLAKSREIVVRNVVGGHMHSVTAGDKMLATIVLTTIHRRPIHL